jgi:hydroxymethylbilane synthase
MNVLYRIGARASALSLAQTDRVRTRMAAAFGVPPHEVEARLPIVPMTTSGDRLLDRRLLEAGGKGLFTKELDEALLDGRIDVAIHSLKDLPTQLPDGIVLAAVPEREDARDAFLSPLAATLEDLPPGARLGTASLRRQAQALFLRPDLRVVTLRGNVQTRIDKLDAQEFDATFLAVAGLKRLGLDGRITSFVDPESMPPAAGQGALAITTRADAAGALAAMNNPRAAIEVAAERAFLAALDGSCHTPIAAHAQLAAGVLYLIGEALTPDGRRRWRRTIQLADPDRAAAAQAGAGLGAALGAEAGAALRPAS